MLKNNLKSIIKLAIISAIIIIIIIILFAVSGKEYVQEPTNTYEDIVEETKQAIVEDKSPQSDLEVQGQEFSEQESDEQDSSLNNNISLSEDNLPLTILDLLRSEIRTTPGEGCHTEFPSTEYLSAIYRGGSKSMIVALSRYKDNKSAQSFPVECTEYSNSKMAPQINSLERKNDVSEYPFWLMTATVEGELIILSSFSVVSDIVIQTVIPIGNGGVESEHREAVSAIIDYLRFEH